MSSINIKCLDKEIDNKNFPKNIVKPKIVKNSVGCCDYIQATFFNTIGRKFDKKNEKGLKLELIRTKIQVSDRIRDFNYVLKKMDEVDALKMMFLNEQQALCMSYLQKPNDVKIEESLHKFSFLLNPEEENEEIIVNYFTKLLEDPLNKEDSFLFSHINSKIREKVMTRLVKKD
jgi:hypothetical protein